MLDGWSQELPYEIRGGYIMVVAPQALSEPNIEDQTTSLSNRSFFNGIGVFIIACYPIDCETTGHSPEK